MRKAEQAKERRKSMIFVIIAVVVGVGLVAAVAIPSYLRLPNDPANKALSHVRGLGRGRRAAADVQTTDGRPATACASTSRTAPSRSTTTVPPSYGPHWAAPAFPAREFYTARDRPEMEQLVHNLEHGYTIVWYDDTIKGDQLDELRTSPTSARTEDAVGPTGKFIVSAWDDAYGDVPERQAHRHVALGRHGRPRPAVRQGQRRGRRRTSSTQFPASDSPEPNAA